MKKTILLPFLFCFVLAGSLPAAFSHAAEKKPKQVNEKITQPPQVSTKAPTPPALPDLVVDMIWLDASCKINFRIKNVGPGGMSDDRHKQGVVSLSMGSAPLEFYFIKEVAGHPPVDLRGALKNPGGMVDYNTGIKLEKPAKINVLVDPNTRIPEANESNNQKLTPLLPECLIQKPGAAAGSMPVLTKKETTAPAQANVATTALPAATSAPRLQAGSELNMAKVRSIIAERGLNRRGVTTRSLDGGIHLHKPSDGSITRPSFTFNYSIDCRKDDGDITFVLVSDGVIVSEHTHRFTYTGTRPATAVYVPRNFTWHISPDTPNSERAGVIAVKSDASGISDPFPINLRHSATVPIGMGLNVDLGTINTAFVVGTTLNNITITVDRTRAIDQVELLLEPYRESASDTRTTATFPINTGGPATIVYYNWTIPATAVPGRYRLHFRAVNALNPEYIHEWYSPIVNILPVPPPARESTGMELRVDVPIAYTVHLASTDILQVGWYSNIGRDSTRETDLPYRGQYAFTRVLLKGGVERQRIGPISYYGRSFIDFFSVRGYEPGSDYQVRIELVRPGDTAGTWVQLLSDTSGNISIAEY